MNKDERFEIADQLIRHAERVEPQSDCWIDVGDDIVCSTVVCCLSTLSLIFEAEIDELVAAFDRRGESDRCYKTAYGSVRLTRAGEKIYVRMDAEDRVSCQDTEGGILWKE